MNLAASVEASLDRATQLRANMLKTFEDISQPTWEEHSLAHLTSSGAIEAVPESLDILHPVSRSELGTGGGTSRSFTSQDVVNSPSQGNNSIQYPIELY